jgi:hypothetical protein
MPRRISPSQLKSKLRALEQQQKRAVNNYNQAVRRHNQAIRNYNSRVRANRQRLRSELNRLASRNTVTTRFTIYYQSVQSLQQSYAYLDQSVSERQLSPEQNWILDLSEREAANSAAVSNQLLGNEYTTIEDAMNDAELRDGLREISEELNDRWKGAIFALKPENPDAARHFCTSAREIFTRILDITAPDQNVVSIFPDCQKTDDGRPTRRAKIKYLLYRRGISEATLEDFVEEDMDNIVQLFRVFNDGTHGSTGTFTMSQLFSIRKRVEDGILYLTEIASPS